MNQSSTGREGDENTIVVVALRSPSGEDPRPEVRLTARQIRVLLPLTPLLIHHLARRRKRRRSVNSILTMMRALAIRLVPIVNQAPSQALPIPQQGHEGGVVQRVMGREDLDPTIGVRLGLRKRRK